MSIRLFAAITLALEVEEDLAEFLEPRREVDSSLRWSAADRWHITLSFMPAVSDRSYDDLVERLSAAVAKRPPLSLGLTRGGAFPTADRAKVLYAGVSGDLEELTRLSVGVRNAANTAGVNVDGATFRPHVTLARAAQPLDATRWLRVLDTYAGPQWQAEEVELIQSELGAGPRGAARYHTVEAFPLGSSDAS